MDVFVAAATKQQHLERPLGRLLRLLLQPRVPPLPAHVFGKDPRDLLAALSPLVIAPARFDIHCVRVRIDLHCAGRRRGPRFGLLVRVVVGIDPLLLRLLHAIPPRLLLRLCWIQLRPSVHLGVHLRVVLVQCFVLLVLATFSELLLLIEQRLYHRVGFHLVLRICQLVGAAQLRGLRLSVRHIGPCHLELLAIEVRGRVHARHCVFNTFERVACPVVLVERLLVFSLGCVARILLLGRPVPDLANQLAGPRISIHLDRPLLRFDFARCNFEEHLRDTHWNVRNECVRRNRPKNFLLLTERLRAPVFDRVRLVAHGVDVFLRFNQSSEYRRVSQPAQRFR